MLFCSLKCLRLSVSLLIKALWETEVARAFCSCFSYYNQALTLTFQWVVRTVFIFYLVTPLNCSLLLWYFYQTWDWLRTSNVHVATSSNTSKFLKVFEEWRRIWAIMIIPKIWVVRTRWFMFDPEYQFALIFSSSLVHSQKWILGPWIFRTVFSLYFAHLHSECWSSPASSGFISMSDFSDLSHLSE